MTSTLSLTRSAASSGRRSSLTFRAAILVRRCSAFDIAELAHGSQKFFRRLKAGEEITYPANCRRLLRLNHRAHIHCRADEKD